MEQLTASPYIAFIYVFCVNEQLTKYSRGGDIPDRMKDPCLIENGERSSKYQPFGNYTNLAKIGIQIMSTVADMHECEKDEVPSIMHQDVCWQQIMFVD